MSTNIDGTILDQLFEMQLQRAAELRKTGEPFRHEGSSKEFLAVLSTDGDLLAESTATLRKFQEIEGAIGRFLVLDFKQEAGRTRVKVAAVHGYLQVATPTVTGKHPISQQPITTLAQKYSALPYCRKGGSFAVQASAVNTGDVITVAGDMYLISGKSVDQHGLAVLDLQPYQLPGSQPQKSLQDSYAWGTGNIKPRPSNVWRPGY